jgi:hypothetical protein
MICKFAMYTGSEGIDNGVAIAGKITVLLIDVIIILKVVHLVGWP